MFVTYSAINSQLIRHNKFSSTILSRLLECIDGRTPFSFLIIGLIRRVVGLFFQIGHTSKWGRERERGERPCFGVCSSFALYGMKSSRYKVRKRWLVICFFFFEIVLFSRRWPINKAEVLWWFDALAEMGVYFYYETTRERDLIRWEFSGDLGSLSFPLAWVTYE